MNIILFPTLAKVGGALMNCINMVKICRHVIRKLNHVAYIVAEVRDR